MTERKIPEVITENDFLRLIKKVRRPNHRIAFILGFYGAMRVSEIANLQQENIDRGQKLIRIKQGKGRKDRNIPLPPQSVRGLSYIPVRCGVRALQIAFKNYGQKVLKKDLHFHQLRHSGATHYLNKKKWSTRQVQVLLGHSKIQTTEIYTHVSPDVLIEKMWSEE
jgi:integrase/recombinase XerD